jgi:signal transduction histidine kinase/DNA-binding response OmpR family regulator
MSKITDTQQIAGRASGQFFDEIVVAAWLTLSVAGVLVASFTSLTAGILGIGAGLFASLLIVNYQKRERVLIQGRSEAERRSREKSSFLANMSHEIRAPMNAILGFSELLDNDHLNDSQRKYLQSIRSSASSLQMLVSDMLDISKIEAGILELHPEPIDPYELCQFIQAMFTESAGRKQLSLKCNAAEDLPRSLLLDRVRLRQILVNLVGNAVKFTDRGSIKLSIGWENQVPGKLLTLLIDVKDTGVGIPADRLETIFNPFAQAGAHPDKESEGTGLGLAIVKCLAETMGGSVIVTSELGRGSIFQFRFPNVAVSARVPASEQLMSSAATDFNCLRPATVLGVDDNPTNRELLQAMLNGSHHRLLLASSGQQAIEMARRETPDLILLDLRMPEMGGRKVLRALREVGSLEMTPVIAITASSLPSEQAEIKSCFNGYLEKPFSRQDLFNEIARFLPRHSEAGTASDQHTLSQQSSSLMTAVPDISKTVVEEKDPEFGVLKHDLKSSLAGVIMSAELLLEQASCLNDEKSRRLVAEILGPGRLFLDWLKAFSTQSAWPAGAQAEGNHLPKNWPDNLRAQCGHMRADAQELCGQLTRRAGGRSVQLAENIVRSCTALTKSVEELTAHSNTTRISRGACGDVAEAAARSPKRSQLSTQRKPLRVFTPIYAAHGLSGY